MATLEEIILTYVAVLCQVTQPYRHTSLVLARKKEQEAFPRKRELCMTCSRKSMVGSRGVSLPRRCCMSHQCSQRSLLLAPHELGQLKLLVQAHRTPQAVARRAQLIEASHTHPDWGTKQMARA